MPNIPEEVACVTTLGSLLGIAMANVQDAPSVFGPTERGIDVVFDLEGRRIGAQHTVFHFDEGTPGQRGSQARATSSLPVPGTSPTSMTRPGSRVRCGNFSGRSATRAGCCALLAPTWW